jgi:far upstream element-binding protein
MSFIFHTNLVTLQEKAGVKMVMIQETNAPTAQDKPLRITGDPNKVRMAKEMVFDLLAEKESQSGSYGGNDYGGTCVFDNQTS